MNASDGLAIGHSGAMYVTMLESSGVSLYDYKTEYRAGESSHAIMDMTLLMHDSDRMHWPDTLGFDHKGSILFVSNKLNLFVSNDLDWSEYNFRIWKADVGDYSYQHGYTFGQGVPSKNGPFPWILAVFLIVLGGGLTVAGFFFYSRRRQRRYMHGIGGGGGGSSFSRSAGSRIWSTSRNEPYVSSSLAFSDDESDLHHGSTLNNDYHRLGEDHQ
eukprot:TRINITY_DN29952_c0_g1_i1.p1 TRINITY_DN29952_c0_g1~~TRINITY_DN29952_c0_g1_i1.p1  ORF type:complete len:240 (+),score=115.44 TRINITY_DN29952_c0_g1_i1:76-720(+)